MQGGRNPLFNFIVTDMDMVNEDKTSRNDAMISSFMGQMFLICHPDIVEKVKEAMGASMGLSLPVFTKEEWEKLKEEKTYESRRV